jgi:2'-5' RNA ligase
MPATRTFIAIHLPLQLREALLSICAQLRDSPGGRAARWVAGDNIHVTLKFLGDVDNGRLPDVQRAITGACAGGPPFRMTVAGLGCFPGLARPRVVWAGIDQGARELAALAGSIDQSLGELGFARESRPFSAHITLARADRRASNVELATLGRTIASQDEAEIGVMTVDSVSVVQSDLFAGGPVYTDLSISTLGSQPLPRS